MRNDVTELLIHVDNSMENIGIQINCFDKLYSVRENEAMERFRKSTGVPKLVCDIEGTGEPIAKIVFADMHEEQIVRVKELLDTHPRSADFDYVRSEKTLYEILPKGINKGAILPRIAEHLGVDMSRTIAVGDYNNDVSMLRSAGIGIAVANATPEAKAAAKLVTVSNEDHAIAQIINDIESGKIVFCPRSY